MDDALLLDKQDMKRIKTALLHYGKTTKDADAGDYVALNDFISEEPSFLIEA